MAIDMQEHAELSATIGALDDVQLVEMMLGLLVACDDGPLLGGITEGGATATRITFSEIARRWIPPDVFGDAFRAIGGSDDA